MYNVKDRKVIQIGQLTDTIDNIDDYELMIMKCEKHFWMNEISRF